MRYYIAYPILFDCDLRCNYCFHYERHVTNYAIPQAFTVEQYKKFRDTHLRNAEDIVIHFHGGETFLDTNTRIVQNVMRSTDKERFDLLSNGIQRRENYASIIPFKDRIDRIGMTFHRQMIGHVPSLVKKYEANVRFLHEAGLPVYVKELLFPGTRNVVRESRRYWKKLGIRHKVQDFKGYDRGKDFSEQAAYDYEDYLLIDSEYKHSGPVCSCRKLYKNVLIGAHINSGDVLACFEDFRIVGSIQENTYNPNYRVEIDRKNGGINVTGVPAKYKGTWEKGLYAPGCGSN